MTPEEYLAQHELTSYVVERLGLTPRQLDELVFRRQFGERFSSWAVVPRSAYPVSLETDVKAWCALRWLLTNEENSENAADRVDAWDFVARYLETLPVRETGRRLNERRDGVNRERKQERDDFVRTTYLRWEKRVASQLHGMDAGARVQRYIASKRGTLPDRVKRRLLKLLRENKLSTH